MKNILVFLQGKHTPAKESFMKNLSAMLPKHVFQVIYEGENPFVTEVTITGEVDFFFVETSRQDIMAIIAMATIKFWRDGTNQETTKLFQKIIFFGLEDYKNDSGVTKKIMPPTTRYFLEKLRSTYIEGVEAEKGGGVYKFERLKLFLDKPKTI
jgi:hypothetical protein